MRLGIKDHKVIRSFVDRVPLEGNKLSTDGKRLDGHWLGGSRIADWQSGEIVFHDLGSKAAQSVQKQVRYHAAPNMLRETREKVKRSAPKRSKAKRSTKKRKLTNLRRVRLRGFGVRRHGVSMPAYSTMLSRVEVGNKSYHYLLNTIAKHTKISPQFAKSLLEIIQLRLYEGRITSEEAQLLAAFVEARR